MDSCHRNNIALGFDMARRVHFGLQRDRKKIYIKLGVCPQPQNNNMSLAIDNCAY